MGAVRRPRPEGAQMRGDPGGRLAPHKLRTHHHPHTPSTFLSTTLNTTLNANMPQITEYTGPMTRSRTRGAPVTITVAPAPAPAPAPARAPRRPRVVTGRIVPVTELPESIHISAIPFAPVVTPTVTPADTPRPRSDIHIIAPQIQECAKEIKAILCEYSRTKDVTRTYQKAVDCIARFYATLKGLAYRLHLEAPRGELFSSSLWSIAYRMYFAHDAWKSMDLFPRIACGGEAYYDRVFFPKDLSDDLAGDLSLIGAFMTPRRGKYLGFLKYREHWSSFVCSVDGKLCPCELFPEFIPIIAASFDNHLSRGHHL